MCINNIDEIIRVKDKRISDLRKQLRNIRQETLEEAARVADEWPHYIGEKIAAEIRQLGEVWG